MERTMKTKMDAHKALCQTVLALLFLSGTILSCMYCLTDEGINWMQVWMGAALALALCAGMSLFPRISPYAWVLPLLEAAGVVLAMGPDPVLRGARGFINYLIGWWNMSHEDGLLLLPGTPVTSADLFAFSLALILIMAAWWWRIAEKRSLMGSGLPILLCAAGLLSVERFSPPAFALLLSGMAGVWIFRLGGGKTVRQWVWMILIACALWTAGWMLKGTQADAVDAARKMAGETLHRMRYGSSALPDGDLYGAHTMLDGDAPVLTVVTEQQKSLYLRGFVGGRYRQGIWQPLPKSAYGGQKTGLLQWLDEQKLTPAAQYASYLRADGSEERAVNRVSVENTGTDRSYLYLPYSTDAVHSGKAVAEKDAQYRSSGLLGSREYQFEEYADHLPGELLQSGGWLLSPQTDAQRQYAEAEAVYRSFVYENYLETDPDLTELIQRIFWADDESAATGVYAATERIRSVLQDQVAYRAIPQPVPVNQDPVRWFLTSGRQGNAALFASAAVEAYRVYGIPARYAEGYLLKEGQAAKAVDGRVELTDQDGHAWAEVYIDGLGWVPVDVTPGFYYDAYVLQQMVESPKGIRQTAALEEGDEAAEQLSQEQESAAAKDAGEDDRECAVMLAGVLTVLLTAACLILFVMEARRWYCQYRLRVRYEKLPDQDRVWLLYQDLCRCFTAMGLELCLGGDYVGMETKLEQMIPAFRKGECLRVMHLLEKFIYGGEPLEAYEERTLQCFLEKIYRQRAGLNIRGRLKIRYCMKQSLKSG